ncbi:hypothetical protein VTJ83DRAFT_4825 [Remersonia thermophila]|uniref:Uncharacterized protein n=1 Tax=Remersonia thermophila TaxID=72144 RepID=A0ABR4DB14_9PEZI
MLCPSQVMRHAPRCLVGDEGLLHQATSSLHASLALRAYTLRQRHLLLLLSSPTPSEPSKPSRPLPGGFCTVPDCETACCGTEHSHSSLQAVLLRRVLLFHGTLACRDGQEQTSKEDGRFRTDATQCVLPLSFRRELATPVKRTPERKKPAVARRPWGVRCQSYGRSSPVTDLHPQASTLEWDAMDTRTSPVFCAGAPCHRHSARISSPSVFGRPGWEASKRGRRQCRNQDSRACAGYKGWLPDPSTVHVGCRTVGDPRRPGLRLSRRLRMTEGRQQVSSSAGQRGPAKASRLAGS